jgi:hypothetical protein
MIALSCHFVYIRGRSWSRSSFPCHMFVSVRPLHEEEEEEETQISSQMQWGSESAHKTFSLKKSDKKIRVLSMGFRWMNVVCFSFWFVLLIEIGDHVTSSLECFECSDFPREDYSEDEEQGTCPGWLRPPRFELPKVFCQYCISHLLSDLA